MTERLSSSSSSSSTCLENSMDRGAWLATVHGVAKNHTRLSTHAHTRFSNCASGYLLEENKNTNQKRYMHLYINCSIIYSSQDMEATQVSIKWWMDIDERAHTHNRIWLSYRKEWRRRVKRVEYEDLVFVSLHKYIKNTSTSEIIHAEILLNISRVLST